MQNNTTTAIDQKSPSRRGLLHTLGYAAVGAVASGAMPYAEAQVAYSDLDLLNFALNLEYLESEFYTLATTGQTLEQTGIDITGSGTPGITEGGGRVRFPRSVSVFFDIAREIAYNERQHVQLIREAILRLGGQPVAKPALNLNALGFDGSLSNFLSLARGFEDTGLSAYNGAAPLIRDKNVLATSARIIGTEAQHATALRLQLSLLRSSDVQHDPIDIPPPPNGPKFTSTNQQGLTLVRTPEQVLYIVYGGQANVTAGGFFPFGVNGAVQTSSSPASTP